MITYAEQVQAWRDHVHRRIASLSRQQLEEKFIDLQMAHDIIEKKLGDRVSEQGWKDSADWAARSGGTL